jgi:diacylglycerol kinase (ATP)
MMAHKIIQGMIRIWRALGHSCDGLWAAVCQERAFRQELVLALILTPIAIRLPITSIERLLLIGSIVLVLIVELLNSAIEATIDRISLTPHPLSKRAKDLGSAAVLMTLCLCGLTWVLLVGRLVWNG